MAWNSSTAGADMTKASYPELLQALRFGHLDRRGFLHAALAAGLSLELCSRALAATAPPVPVRSTRTSSLLDHAVDFLVVGGGTAGCVLAHRLSADPAVSVAVLEAGGWVEDPAVDTVANWPALQGGAHDWAYATVPQPSLDGRTLPCPRGRGFGGSSLINATGHQRGNPAAYDAWEVLGAEGWNAETLLPYHRRSERYSGGPDQWRGAEGPLDVLVVDDKFAHPTAKAFIGAADAAGFSWSEDFNGARPGDCAWNQFTISSAGLRAHAARAFIEPVAQRTNLLLLGDAPVIGLAFEGRRCVGVNYLHNGLPVMLRATRGVIMAAGAIDTPRLLMLSGLGPAEQLDRLGIEVRADLSGVGAGLQDHPLVGGVAFEAPRAVPMSRYNHSEGMLLAGADGSSGGTDLMIMCVTLPFVIPTLGVPPEHCITLVPCLMQPQSRGSVTLRSADPLDPAVIDPGTYSEQGDFENMLTAVEICRELGNGSAMKDWVAGEVFAGLARSAEGLREFVRRGTSPLSHPVGTVRMGVDAAAPLSPDLRVKGVDGLWVADASVMPRIVPAMTNAPVVAIAERAADLVLAAT